MLQLNNNGGFIFQTRFTDTHVIHTHLLLATKRNGYLDATGKFMITFSGMSLAVMPIIYKFLKKSFEINHDLIFLQYIS